MRGKLTLKLDDLSVDSFDTSAAERPKGTVFGEQCTCYTNCTCPGCPTCDATCGGAGSCAGTCGATCEFSCYGTCGEYSCGGSCNGYCTHYDITCNNIGTCNPTPGWCADTP